MADSFLKNDMADELVRALLSLEGQEECYAVLEDMFTIREVHDLSQRLAVARMLREGATYAEITEKTGASTATVGRVNRALQYGAGGYDKILNKLYGEDKTEHA